MHLWMVGLLFFSQAHAIVDGKKDDQNLFPFVYGLKFSQSLPSGEIVDSLCTAVGIDERTLLTSAHCFIDKQGHERQLEGIFSSSDLNRESEGEILQLESKALHPEYNPAETNAYVKNARDLAIIRLKSKTPTHTRSLPLILPFEIEKEINRVEGKTGTLVGYGVSLYRRYMREYEKNGYDDAGIKRHAEVPINHISAHFVAHQGKAHRMGPGDSGGAFLMQIGSRPAADGSERPVYRLLGINSSVEDGDPLSPLNNQCEKHIVVRDGQIDRAATKESKRRCYQNAKKMARKGLPDPEHDYSYATALTARNLCWVQQESKIQFAGLECPSK